MSQLSVSGGQSTGASASASALPVDYGLGIISRVCVLGGGAGSRIGHDGR